MPSMLRGARAKLTGLAGLLTVTRGWGTVTIYWGSVLTSSSILTSTLVSVCSLQLVWWAARMKDEVKTEPQYIVTVPQPLVTVSKPARPASLALAPRNIEGVTIETPSRQILSFDTLMEGTRTGLTPTTL